MNKPSWLSWINFTILILVLCSTFGIIDPKSWKDKFSQESGIKVITPIEEIREILHLHKIKLENIENNGAKYALKSDISNISNSLKLKLNEHDFKQFYVSINNKINEHRQAINNLREQTNTSNEIEFWKKEYYKHSCDSFNANSNLCLDFKNRISAVQQRLKY